jgi:hypothetical protein
MNPRSCGGRPGAPGAVFACVAEHHLRDMVTAIGVVFVRHRGGQNQSGNILLPFGGRSAPTPLFTITRSQTQEHSRVRRMGLFISAYLADIESCTCGD